MARITVRVRKLADLDQAIPGLADVWRQIKAACNTVQRTPKSLCIADEPRKMILDDGWIGRRFALDLRTMELSETVLHVSAEDGAAHGGDNHDRAVEGIPNGAAVIDCEYNDYHRSFLMTVTVAKGAIPAQLTAA
jgi:hypothetical protein